MTDPFIAAVSEALPQDLRAYKINEVPAKVTPPYAVWSISDERPAARRLDASSGLRFHRFTWQSFGRTLDSARAVDRAIASVVLGHTFAVEGYSCTPMADADRDGIFGAPTRDDDDRGWVGLTSSLTFTATEEQS